MAVEIINLFKLNWVKDDYYNAEDLTRVEANMEYIVNTLIEMGYDINIGELKTEWGIVDIPTLSDFNRIEGNINSVKDGFYTPIGWQDSKVWVEYNRFNYLDAIRYEKNLYLINKLIEVAKEGVKYSGTFHSGQDDIWI